MGKYTDKTTDPAKSTEEPFTGPDTPQHDDRLEKPVGHPHGAIIDYKPLTKDMRKSHRETGK